MAATITVNISVNDGDTIHDFTVQFASDGQGCTRVAADFNPSGLANVERMKLLGAAMIEAIDHVSKTERSSAARCANTAKTYIEIGTMMAVKSVFQPRETQS